MTSATLVANPAPDQATRRLAERFGLSASVDDTPVARAQDVDRWLSRHRADASMTVRRIPWGEQVGWSFDDGGDLRHDSGRFFAVQGLSVSTDWEGRGHWEQPIIDQPEIGVLGILVKEFDGVLHLLMQAKVEPGNIGGVQLSPTVQATRSNYLGVHRGRAVPMMDHFTGDRGSTVLVDALQSEQGAWFLRKRNRNMVVEAHGEVDDHPDFRWMTLGQLHRWLRADNVVNMDARTVLSCIPVAGPEVADDPFLEALGHGLDGRGPSLHTDGELLHWLTGIKARHEMVQRPIPLASVGGWHRSDDAIAHETGKYFRVVGTEVRAGNREVSHWTQPLVEPVAQGLAVFLARAVDGVLHLLVHAKAEAGVLDVAEIAPTLQCQPANFIDLPAHRRPLFLTEALAGELGRPRFSAVQSEEGGRFLHADNRYEIIDVGTDFPLDGHGPGYVWMTPGQITSLLLHSNYVNVQARSLMACLQTLR